MRARELRLSRRFRQIVTATLTAPSALVFACQDATTSAPRDAGSESDAGAHDPCAPIAIDGAAIEPDAAGCAQFRLMPCGLPPDTRMRGCSPDLVTCANTCDVELLYRCQLAPVTCTPDAGMIADASIIMECIKCASGGGRPPRGLCAPRRTSRRGLGEYFASMAHLESASVRAFRDLEGWLTALGAPARLTRGARRAAADERRHARVMARLARRWDGRAERPRVKRTPPPSLLELMDDNAVAGCVGETYGALLATWQSARADDARVARAMARIAIDETRHAALAWEIFRWGARGLGARDLARIRRRLEGALVALERRSLSPSGEAVRRIAGHPAPDVERRLVHDLFRVVRDEMNDALGPDTPHFNPQDMP